MDRQTDGMLNFQKRYLISTASGFVNDNGFKVRFGFER